MPNWVFNSVNLSGSKSDLLKVKEQVAKPFTKMVDEYNFDTKEYERKEVAFSNPIFAFWNIIAPTDIEAYNGQPDYNLPLSEQLKFKTNDWYAWNVRNWGTKWDVGVFDTDKYPDTEIISEADDYILYRMNTAWSPPYPAIQKLSEQYPELTVSLEYEEENGWGGEITFQNGEIVTQTEYDSRCPDCDEYNCLDWDDETSEQFCAKCDYRS
jgi:hypothetical protein